MTQDKLRKRSIRARMAATGEPYSEAARRVDNYYHGESVSGVWDGVEPPYLTARIATAVLLTNGQDRVLLVRAPEHETWALPGRHLHHHEDDPSAAAVSIVPHQLGIEPVRGRMLVVDWSPDPDDADFPTANKATFVFDSGTLDAEQIARITPDPAQVAEYGFHDPASLTRVLAKRVQWRVAAALRARTSRVNPYLVLGIGGH